MHGGGYYPSMRRLDRYIFNEILPPTLLSLTLYVFLLLMNVLFDVAREAVANHISLGVVLKLLYFQMPQLLVVSIPMSVLLGCLIGIGRLSGDSELVAIQAAGIPFRRLTLPVAAIGLVASAVCFYFIAFVAPQGSYAFHLMKRDVFLSRYANTDRFVPRVFHASIPGVLLYYDALEEETGAFLRIFLYEEDPQGLMERVTVAQRGELSFDAETGRVNIYLEDGSTHARRLDAAATEGYSVMSFATYQESREAPGYIRAFSGGLRRNLREMTIPELLLQVRTARAEPNQVVRRMRLGHAQAELHERFALPVAALIFALLGLPLGVMNRRGGKASGFALSLAIVLVYWIGYSILRGAAEDGQMDAVLAIWLPNGVFAFLVLLLTLVRLRRAPSGAFLIRLSRAAGKRLSTLAGRQRRPAGTVPEPEALPQPAAFPQIIDRYVVASFFRIFLFVMLSIYLVYILVEFRSLVGDMVDNDIGFGLVLQYLVFLLPRMTNTILPVACLVATLVGIGMLARAREDVAVKAAGVSVYRLLLPLLFLTVVLSAGSYVIQDRILPTSNQEAQRLRDLIAGREPRNQDPRQPWTMSPDGRMFHYRTANSDRSSLQGLSVYRLNPRTFAMEERFYAEQARYDGSQWQVARAWERKFQPDGNNLKQLEQASVNLGVGPDLFQSEDSFVLWGIQRDAAQMSYSDQRRYIHDLERRGYDALNLRVDLARKVTTPLIPICMVLLGFPFSFRVGAHGSLFGIGLAIGLTVIYWSVLAIFSALGSAAILPPLLAAWAPNIFFASLGLYFSLHLRT